MKQQLKVWLEKEGFSLNKRLVIGLNEKSQLSVFNTDRAPNVVRFELVKNVTLEDYKRGFIGKFEKELKDTLIRTVQLCAIKSGVKIPVKDQEVMSNEPSLYPEFRAYCEKKGIEPLEKPTISSVVCEEVGIENTKLATVFGVLNEGEINEDLLLVLDWFSLGQIQRHSISSFLHYFIPFELLVGQFVKSQKLSWRNDHKKLSNKLEDSLREKLEGEFPEKYKALKTTLKKYSFMKGLKKYLESIFTTEEFDSFWKRNSDITGNAKRIWKKYSLMVQSRESEAKEFLLKKMRGLYKKRNKIVHDGERQISAEEIWLIENILRRIIKKELEKHKAAGN